MKTPQRSGLTLVEVVVSGALILVLMALLLPWIVNSRPVARRTECLNNQRNVALGIIWHASANQSRLPSQADYLVTPGTDELHQNVAEGSSWAVSLLPYLDEQRIYDRWNFKQPWDSNETGPEHEISNRELSSLQIECFACPNDVSAHQVAGGLSYVVNCGIGDSNWLTRTGPRKTTHVKSGQHPQTEPFDWNGNSEVPPNDPEDAEINRDFMLFWPEFHLPEALSASTTKTAPHKIGKIFDGSSNTILLAENINAGTRPGKTTSSWADPQLSSSGFLLPIDATRVAPSAFEADGSLAPFVVGRSSSRAINASLNAGEGMAPFPNSNHPGIGVFAFCDGGVRTLSEDIDIQVYARLLTPSGTRPREIPGFTAEAAVSSDEF